MKTANTIFLASTALLSLPTVVLAAEPTTAAETANTEQAETVARGALTGQILSRENGSPAAGANVRVVGEGIERQTNDEGLFTVELPEGNYTLEISHPAYGTRSIEDVRIVAGVARRANYSFTREPQARGAIEEVVAVAKYTPGTSLDAERDNEAVLDIISSREISITGDSSAAAALSRVTGLTLADGKFIYVRGLGERYSSTLFNGGQLPSPDPTRRVVPLDLFPASILEGVEVQKSYTPDQPAEFGGGAVQLKTRKIPDAFFWEVGVSSGYRDGTTGNDSLHYDGGGSDWFGVDDGTRELPGIITAYENAGRQIRENNFVFNDGLSEAELEQVGESFPVNYDVGNPHLVESYDVKPDLGVSAAFGNRFDLESGGSWGFQLAFDYDHSWQVREEQRRDFTVGGGGELQVNNDFLLQLTRRDVEVSSFAVVGWEPNDFTTLSYTLAWLRQSQGDTEFAEGSNRVNDDLRREFELEWIERELLANQFEGNHLFDSMEIDWTLTLAQAYRYEPDQRNYVYEGDPQGNWLFSTRADGNQRKWEDLEDNSIDARVDFTFPLNPDWALQFDLKTGLAVLDKDRDSTIRRFTFFPANNPALANDPNLLDNQSLEDILNPTYIDPEIFQVRDSTRATDTYAATQTIGSAYLMADWFLNAPWRITGGLRLEDNSQEVRTFALFDPDATPVIAENNTSDILPSLSATWFVDEDSQMTFAVSNTLARPDLKELSEAPYTDNLRDRDVVGNPDLETTEILNLDVRWQHFFSQTENISIGLFYKDFDKPIEFVQRQSTDTIVTLENAKSAELYGLEFETRSQLDFINDSLADFFISLNAALIESEIQLDPATQGVNTNASRELQGQSPWSFNMQLGWEHPVRDESAVLLFQSFGERISEVGIFGAPDVYEQPVPQLDFTWKRAFAENWKMSFKLGNILDSQVEFTQGSEVTRLYENGRRVSIGLSYEGF